MAGIEGGTLTRCSDWCVSARPMDLNSRCWLSGLLRHGAGCPGGAGTCRWVQVAIGGTTERVKDTDADAVERGVMRRPGRARGRTLLAQVRLVTHWLARRLSRSWHLSRPQTSEPTSPRQPPRPTHAGALPVSRDPNRGSRCECGAQSRSFADQALAVLAAGSFGVGWGSAAHPGRASPRFVGRHIAPNR